MKKLFLSFIILCITAGPSALISSEWLPAGRMPFPVYGGEAVVMDSLILIIGGTQTLPDQVERPRPVGLVQAYNPQNNTWHILDTLLVPRYGFAADTLGKNQIVICGGSWQNDQSTYTIERWHAGNYLDTGSEVIYQDTSINRVYLTGHIYQNRFYLFGGVNSPASNISDRFSELIIFDLSSNREVFNSGAMTDKHFLPYHHASVRIVDTVVLIGGVFNGVTNLIRAYALNQTGLDEGKIRDVGKLGTARAGCRAVALPGKIFVLGGYNERSAALSSTELIDLEGFTTGAGPVLQHARREAMAVRFRESIYVFGGWNKADSIVPVIERLPLDDLTPVNRDLSNQTGSVPERFQLGQNYPNPFNSGTVIPFRLMQREDIRLEIYSVTGRLIRTLFSGELPAGEHRISWHADAAGNRSVPSGPYFYRLMTETGTMTGKMILMR